MKKVMTRNETTLICESIKKHIKVPQLSYLIVSILVSVMLIAGAFLSSHKVFADDSVVDQINITVPVSCTMSSTGMNTHNANITNGTYQANIGTTTLKVFCNDNNGFTIYAAGYTGNEIGATNSNKLVGTNASGNATIVTGTATSAGNPDTSNWAMKLAATGDSGDTTGTNVLTIDSDTEGMFSNFHTVPNKYTKVAHKNSSISMDTSSGGATLTTTYAAYISKTQPADTYSGQVIYTLIHPANGDIPVAPNQIGVNFMGNGLTFQGGATKNRVVYGMPCTPMYISTTPEIARSSNVASDGTKTTAYASDADDLVPITASGASKMKVVITYGITFGTGLAIAEGNWDGQSMPDVIIAESEDLSGTETYVFNGDTVTFYLFNFSGDSPITDYDYGFWAQVYPIYSTEQVGVEEITVCSDTYTAQTGAYAETVNWKSKWFIDNNGGITYLEDESAIIDYITDNSATLLGTSIDIYAYNPYTIHYDSNGSTAGTMTNFYTILETNTANSTADLMAYNFKKTGYGFAGWSADQNATVNSNSKIYGPNEKIAGNELTFDGSHEATLYAVWVQSAGNLQSWPGCSSMQAGQVTALTDTRDNNVYTVGKLADGNCWMMENLRLDAANSSDSTKAQGFGGVFTGLANSEDANFANSTTANSKYSTSNITGNDQGYRFPRYNNNNTNIGGTNSTNVTLIVTPGAWNGACDRNNNPDCDAQYSEGNNDHSQWYGYGNYYTWVAAMANTIDMNNVADPEATNTSICPTGWKLPYGDSTSNGATNGGFSYLDLQLGGTGDWQMDNPGEEIVSNRWRSYPNNFVYSGYFDGSTTYNRGTSGIYWSSSTAKNQRWLAHDFHLSSNIANSSVSANSKFYGRSVRCLTSGT